VLPTLLCLLGAIDQSELLRDPVYRHGLALAAELDGDIDEAMGLLRAALADTPDDLAIAFDLARMHFDSGKGTEADVEPFLDLPANSADSHLLRAYLHQRRGLLDRARADVVAALYLEPAHGEAQALAQKLGTAAPTARWWNASLGVSGQYDSNVTVLPEDSPSREAGGRLVVDGLVGARGRARTIDSFALFAVQQSLHGSPRDKLALYDSTLVSVSVGGAADVGPARLKLALAAAEVVIDDLAARFMDDVSASTETSLRLGPASAGVFARGGLRTFHTGNPEGEPGDRDGPRVDAGALVRGSLGPLRGELQGGWQGEFTEGSEQRERGWLGALRVQAKWQALAGRLALEYADRRYPDSAVVAGGRHDRRLSGALDLAYEISSTYRVTAGYVYAKNKSNTPYAYRRNLATLGVEASW
jgi:hypothetical protein